MERTNTFDLIEYVGCHFPGFAFTGNVLDQWSYGLRFDIGLEHVHRALIIYRQAFGNADSVVLVSEDIDWEADLARWYSLFALPGLISPSVAPVLSFFQPLQPTEEREDRYTLSWAEVAQSALNIDRLFVAIANQDHGRSPSVKGRVYILDPVAGLLLHMYDDRGLDIISTTIKPLLPLDEQYADWVNRSRLGLSDDRQR